MKRCRCRPRFNCHAAAETGSVGEGVGGGKCEM